MLAMIHTAIVALGAIVIIGALIGFVRSFRQPAKSVETDQRDFATGVDVSHEGVGSHHGDAGHGC